MTLYDQFERWQTDRGFVTRWQAYQAGHTAALAHAEARLTDEVCDKASGAYINTAFKTDGTTV